MLLLLVLSCVSVVASQDPRPTISNDDHLLQILLVMHHSQTFGNLPSSEKILITELLAAAETDQIKHYIDYVGFDRILTFLDHVNNINEMEAHLLEKYLVQEIQQEEVTTMAPVIGKKRDLQTVLQTVTNNAAFQNLTSDDQAFMKQVLTAAENNALTAFIDQNGYSKIISLVEHIMSPQETHMFIHYLAQHLSKENHHHPNPQPVG